MPRRCPWSVQVQLLMDLHAHLSKAEIIGLLGGTWDADARRIAVSAAFPCRRAPGSLSGTSVELDPAAEVEARALIAAQGLTPVGWRALSPHVATYLGYWYVEFMVLLAQSSCALSRFLEPLWIRSIRNMGAPTECSGV